MFIEVNNVDYELSTKLGTARQLELKFKLPLARLFAHIEEADISELISILTTAAGNNKELEKEMLEHWDYMDIQLSVQELLLNLMFSGTDEEKEKKLAKYPAPDEIKNGIREMLGLPIGN